MSASIFAESIAASSELLQRLAPSDRRSDVVVETQKLLIRMGEQYARLLRINDELMGMMPPLMLEPVSHEDGVTTFRFGEMSIRLESADPSKPVAILGSPQSASIYNALSDEPDDAQMAAARITLEDELEAFYGVAGRIQTRLAERHNFALNKKHGCMEIDITRSRLLEHRKESIIPSFGYGTGGPVLNPMSRGNRLEPTDKGLIHNARTFNLHLTALFASLP